MDGLLAAGLRGGQLLNAKIARFSSLKFASAEGRARLLLLVVLKEEACHLLIVTDLVLLLRLLVKVGQNKWIS